MYTKLYYNTFQIAHNTNKIPKTTKNEQHSPQMCNISALFNSLFALFCGQDIKVSACTEIVFSKNINCVTATIYFEALKCNFSFEVPTFNARPNMSMH